MGGPQLRIHPSPLPLPRREATLVHFPGQMTILTPSSWPNGLSVGAREKTRLIAPAAPGDQEMPGRARTDLRLLEASPVRLNLANQTPQTLGALHRLNTGRGRTQYPLYILGTRLL